MFNLPILTDNTAKKYLKLYMPVVILIVFSGIVFFTHYHLQKLDTKIQETHVEGIAQHIASRLEDSIESRIKALEVMAKRWTACEDTSSERFLNYAASIYSSFTGFQAINWVDDLGVIRIVYPPEQNKSALNKNLHTHPEPDVRKTFKWAESQQLFALTPSIELWQSGQGIASYFPIISNSGKTSGYINGVFKIEPLIEACLPNIDEAFPIGYVVYENDKEIYRNLVGKSLQNNAKVIDERYTVASVDIELFGIAWRLEIAPQLTQLSSGKISNINFLLLLGLSLSVAISVLVAFLIRRSDQNKAARTNAENARAFSDHIISTIPSGLIIVDRDYTVKLVNDSFFRIMGISGDVIGEKLHDAIDQTKRPGVLHDQEKCPFCQQINKLFAAGEASSNSIVEVTNSDGRRIWIKFSVASVDFVNREEAVIVFEDVTEKHNMEITLLQRKEYIEALVKYAPDAVVTLDQEHRVVEWNQGAVNLFGYIKEEVVGLDIDDLITGEDKIAEAHDITRSLLAGKSIDSIETIRFRKNGSPVDVILAGSPIFHDKQLIGVVVIYTNISEIVAARAELQKSEERYRNFLHLSSEAIWRYDFDQPLPTHLPVDEQVKWGYANAYLAECNDAMAKMYGFDSNTEILGARLNDILPEVNPESLEFLRSIIENSYRLNDIESIEVDRFGNRKIYLNNMVGVIKEGELHHLWGTQRDITAKKLAEEQLLLLAHTMSSINEAVTITNLEERVVFVNDAFCRIYECSKDDVLGTKLESITVSDQSPTPSVIHQRTIEGGFEGELINRKSTGALFPVYLSTSIIKDDKGKVLGLVGIARDISLEKQTELEIIKSEEKYRNLVETSPDAIFMADKDMKITVSNRQGLMLLGAEKEEDILGKDHTVFLRPQDIESTMKNVERMIASGETFKTELDVKRLDGKIIPVEIHASIFNKQRDEHNFILVVRDISSRRENELTQEILYNIANSVNTSDDLDGLLETIRLEIHRLVDTSNFFIALYEKETDTISLPYIVDEKDKITSFPAGKTFTAYVIKNGESILIDEDKAKTMIAEGKIQQYGSMCKVWLGVPLKIGKEIIGAVVLQNYEDMTAFNDKHLEIIKFVSGQIALAIQRKQAEDAIRDSEERYRTVVENSYSGITLIDSDYKIIYANDMTSEICGYSRDELLDMDFRNILEEDSLKIVVDRYIRRQRGESVPARYDFEIVHKNGNIRKVEMISKVFVDSEGEVNTITQILDITERDKTERALRASEEFTRGIVMNAPVGIIYLDKKGQVIFENPSMAQVTGRTETRDDVWKGEEILNIEGVITNIKPDIMKLLDGHAVSGIEFDYKPRSGKIRRIEMHGSPRKDIDGNLIGAVVMCFDLTEYKAMESHLRHIQKMEAIGTLAGGIAHDFNNILTGIIGNAELAIMHDNDKEQVKERLLQMQRSAERAAELTSRLLAFGRQRMELPKPANLNSAVDEAVEFLGHTIDKKIEIVLRKEPNLWVVRADLGQMNQVFINLIVNAADAMPNGGTISINTSNMNIDDKYCQVHSGARIGEFVKIELQDTGCGIPDSIIDRIFEPFFTTKPFGKGSGLGLAMVYGIIKGHEGWIQAYSEDNKGTNFKIYLPRVKESIQDDRKKEEVVLRGGVETVLLVDDEEIVRSLGSNMLERFGYKVILAKDGIEAQELYIKHQADISLVILDMTMPRKSGRDTLVDLMDLDPKIKIIISSGFDRSGPVEELIKMGAMGFVQKPYKISDMLNAIRGILDS